MALKPDVAFNHFARVDRVLARHIKRVGPCRLKPRLSTTPFAALAESIAYQQLTGKAAATIWRRVILLFPAGEPLDPARVRRIPDEKLREAGLSGAKTAALKDLAQKTMDGVVPDAKSIRQMDDATLIERLTSVRGIGRWTVEMLLIFKLGRPDILPIHDYGVRKGFARVYGLGVLPTPKELGAHGEKWRPHRTVASWYLWRALEAESPW